MAEKSLRGPDLKKTLKLARKLPLNFAYCPGGGEDEDFLLIDRKKKPDVLGRTARGEGIGTKLAFGQLTLTGKVVSLQCDKVLAGLAKKIKKYLRFEKAPLNVVVLDADGNILEEDIEDLPDDPEMEGDDAAEETGGAEAGDSALIAAGERFAALRAEVAALPEDRAAKLVQALRGVAGALKAEDAAGADAAMDKIAAAVEKLAAAPGPSGAAMDQLRKVAEVLQGGIAALAPGSVQDKLAGAHGLLMTHIEAGDAGKAAATAKKIQGALKNAPKAEAAPTSEEGQDASPFDTQAGQAWRAARAQLEPAVLDLLSAGKGDTSKLRGAWALFTERGEGGDYDGAMKVVPALEKLLAEGEAAAQSEAEAAVPAGLVSFVKARHGWAKARQGLKSELMKLENAILSQLQGEAFAGIAQDTKALFGFIEGIDARLEQTLDDLTTEPDGGKRERLKQAARQVLMEYQGELSAPFFQDVDSNNGFAQVNVTGAATKALAEVEDALKQSVAA